MSYAVLQRDAPGPTAAQLIEAFRTTPRLVDADANRRARHALCILARGLERDEAAAIARSLEMQGASAVVVAEDDLFDLPQPMKLKRAAVLASHFEVYDALGRPTPIAWQDVLVVAAGSVPQEQRQRNATMRVVHAAEFSYAVMDVTYKDVTADRMTLEVLVNSEPSRYRVLGNEFVDVTPGIAPAANQAQKVDRFGQFVRNLLQHATSAVLNKGAGAMGFEEGRTASYQSRRAFEEEIVWLVWRSMQD